MATTRMGLHGPWAAYLGFLPKGIVSITPDPDWICVVHADDWTCVIDEDSFVCVVPEDDWTMES